MKHAFLDNTLVCKDEKCLDELEVLYSYKVFKKKPKKCPHCGSENLEGLELVGIKEGALFWECDECLFKFLKYSIKNTLDYLKEGDGYWYNPNNWKNIERN